MDETVIAGWLSMPVHLQGGSLSDLINTQARASSSSARLLFIKEHTAAAVSDATLVAAALSNCTDQAALLTWGFAALEDLLRGSYGSSDGHCMSQCRARMKALHLLLQSQAMQLKVVAVAASTHEPSKQQQQQEQQEQQETEAAVAVTPQSSQSASLATAEASEQASRKPAAKGRQRQCSTGSAQPDCSGWVTIAVMLLPDFFYLPQPTAAATSGDSVIDKSACDPASWTVLPDSDMNDQRGKAVNTLVTMLMDLTTLQQHQQQDGLHQQLIDDNTDTDDEYKLITDSCSISQRAEEADTCTAAVIPVDHFKHQFQLYSCPDAAAAARTDVRQSLFDWVDSSAWHHEAADPQGLTNRLYRYQRRALSWMIWRETHGTQPIRHNSSSSACGLQLGCPAQGLLGCQLLNPLWTEVKLNAVQPPLQPSTHSCHCQQTSVSIQPSPSPPNNCPNNPHIQPGASSCLTVYHAVSSGVVSRVRPAGYCGPAGGLLADEMGLGKTVEVLALLLARPPPEGVKGTRGVTTAALTYDDYDDGNDDDFIWMSGFKRPRTQRQQRRQPQQLLQQQLEQTFDAKHSDRQPRQQVSGSGLKSETMSSSMHWPSPGQWAGGTLVVAPPAILQQWVSEAQRHAPGLTVEVYEGLKWHRAQQEAQQRKTQARQSKGARAQQALLEQYYYAVNGPPDEPVFDADEEAADAVKMLLRADMIITTFDVLRQEVYFSGGDADRLSSLRHKKRYAVPQSPLLQVDWWRLVLDEAQLVGGGLSSTAVMAGHITARHRWAVTGTPIGLGGLDDVGNLLRLIGAAPFDSPHTFRRAIQEPFARSVAAAVAAVEDQDQQEHHQQHELDEAGASHLITVDQDMPIEQPQQQQGDVVVTRQRRYGRAERDGVRRLLALLQPLMWRSNKEAAAADHPLPPRHLQCALLRFSPAERSFYNNILDKTAAANKELQQKQEQAAAADDQQQQRCGRQRRSKSSSYEDQLQQLAAGQILQLRLACIHPQLTSYWRELSSELQLRQGGALSIAEIMTRMKDATQLKLQQAERELCVTLNVLADKLIKQATDAEEAAGGGGGGSGSGEAPAARQGKKRGGRSSGASSSNAQSSAAPAAGAVSEVQHDGSDVDDDLYEPGSKQRHSGASGRSKKRVRFATDHDAAAVSTGDCDGLDSSAAASSSSSGRRRTSSSGVAASQSPADMKAAALELLEDSYKVGEYGIAALTGSSSSSVSEPLTDIAGGDATWRAWKHVGLHTAQSLSRVCADLGMSIKSELYAADVARKRAELLETVTAEVTKAEVKYNSHKSKVEELAAELTTAWSTAADDEVPMSAMTGCADPSTWLSELSSSIAAAKAVEVTLRQQQCDDQAVAPRATTVLLGHEVTKVLEAAEAAAAADRALLEGIVGQVHTRKVAGLLTTLLTSAAAAAGTAGGTAGSRRTKDSRNSHKRKMAVAAGRQGHADGDYEPDFDEEDDISSGDELDVKQPTTGRGRRRPAAAVDGGVGGKAHSGSADAMLTRGAEAWAQGSGLQAHQAAEAIGVDVDGYKVAAARAATYQYLDCLPERRAVWRLLFRGSLGVDGAAAVPGTVDNSNHGGGMSSSVMLTTPESAAIAMGGLLQVYAATAFNSSSSAGSSQQHLLSTAEAGSGQVAPNGACAYGTHVFSNATASHVRQLLRRLHKREAGFVRAVDAAVAAGSGGDTSAAHRLATAYLVQQQQLRQLQHQQQPDLPETAAVSSDGTEINIRDVNVPLLLHQLPLSAVAAAADAARVRIDVCRAHREVYVSDLGLEVAVHNRQLVEDEADMAAAGNDSQVLQLADKSEPELRKSVSELIKKCDELLRHKRFLANQAAESTHLAQLGRKRRRSPAGQDGDPDHLRDGGGDQAGGEGDDETDDLLECAVCRSAMSDELQVFSCGHYFCDSCAAVQLSQPNPTCAYCRARVTKTGVFRVSLAGSGGHEPEVDPPEGQAVTHIKVTGVWMTKLEALLRRVLLMREIDPGSKALVFSQFPDALVLASKALDVMKVKHVSLGLGGGKDRRMAMRAAVKSFNEDPEVCIFLLSLRAGSSGLTLTAASRVFLLEPGVDPAIEQQAVARVHRIGQEKEVVITRLLMQGTVEEQVLKISEDKQALLTEAAHQHHQLHSSMQHHQLHSSMQHHQHHTPAAGAAGQHEGEESAEEDEAAEVDDVDEGVTGTPRPTQASTRPHHYGSGTAGDITAPTTLQALAPKRERVGGGEAVGLLEAVMQQARQQQEF